MKNKQKSVLVKDRLFFGGEEMEAPEVGNNAASSLPCGRAPCSDIHQVIGQSG